MIKVKEKVSISLIILQGIRRGGGRSITVLERKLIFLFKK
jgi:hypothetical protein